MKGIILAGGSGTRLYPITMGTSKQLQKVYDKPMIYYPLSILMLAGIRDILLITTKEDQQGFMNLFGDGSELGININYVIQPKPEGLAQAFVLGEEFIGDDTCAMVLGDNVFFGNGLVKTLNNAKEAAEAGYASIFGKEVKDPERFGIMELDENNNVIGVEEKPENPKSSFAITGLYFYPTGVSEMAKNVKKSNRGEYEITTLNEMYLNQERLRAELLGGGYSWYDTGTHKSILSCENHIMAVQENSGKIVASLEEIAYNNGWIDDEQLLKRAELQRKTGYGEYLYKVLNNKNKKVRKLTM